MGFVYVLLYNGYILNFVGGMCILVCFLLCLCFLFLLLVLLLFCLWENGKMEIEERMFIVWGGRMFLCIFVIDIFFLFCRLDLEWDSGERVLGEEGEYYYWESLRVRSRGGRSGGREKDERVDLEEKVVVFKGEGGDGKWVCEIWRLRRRYYGC